jgi:hypothetical protein
MLLAAVKQSAAQQAFPGVAGFLVVAGMGVAVYFLFRLLNKQLRKISPPGAPGAPGRPGKPRRGLAAHRAQQAEAAAAATAPPPRRQPGGTGSEPSAGGDPGPV